MICNCCLSNTIEINPIGIIGYSRCRNCNFLFSNNNVREQISQQIIHHYQYQDPHQNVSYSKTSFFNYVLDYLELQTGEKDRKILDVGCGYGYFLNLASQAGWEPYGIEILEDAVKKSRDLIGYKNIIEGELKEANLTEKTFDAITLWDVIAIMDNPYDEIKECYRLLKKGGIIGIRTRNATFQTAIFRLFDPIKKMAKRFRLKEPYVFNQHCYSSKALKELLKRTGFINIQILNSPLTSGDPYNHISFHYFISLIKKSINIFSKLIFWMTHGRKIAGPSLLIWAEKP